ncbi:MAG: hypothetical protein RIQ89_2398 [Bacteroidota bacterium]|jgi:biopolymer transport protein ExbD
MPKIKIPKKSPSLDMTPMVDLAFLLVTFFMLTTQFRADEPVTVDTPSSVSEILLPEKDVITLTVDSKGRVFFNVDGKGVRKNIIEKLGERYEIKFTEDEVKRFSVLSSVGQSMADMKKFLSAGEEERKRMNEASKGIPHDSLQNELTDWVRIARLQGPKFNLAIKGDQDADIPTIKRVISILQDNKANRFALITNMEGAGEADKK